VVASEPCDDEPGWTEVPASSVITATPQQVSVVELAAANLAAANLAPANNLDTGTTWNTATADGRITTR
jgi:hypothetical protein